jgi:hypothetical protein
LLKPVFAHGALVVDAGDSLQVKKKQSRRADTRRLHQGEDEMLIDFSGPAKGEASIAPVGELQLSAPTLFSGK